MGRRGSERRWGGSRAVKGEGELSLSIFGRRKSERMYPALLGGAVEAVDSWPEEVLVDETRAQERLYVLDREVGVQAVGDGEGE
jgi:hypothetical protein